MICAGVGRRSARPPRKTASKAFAAAAPRRSGEGIGFRFMWLRLVAALLMLRSARSKSFNETLVRSLRDVCSRRCGEREQQLGEAVGLLELRAVAAALEELVRRARHGVDDVARAAVGDHPVT